MIYGYLRVSTERQSTEVQKYEIEKYCKQTGIMIDIWVDEKISGAKKIKNRKIKYIIDDMKSGDTIICTEISRLGRSMQIIFEVMNLCLERGVILISLKENYILNDSPMSKFILSVYSYAAETERILISERTKEGLAARKRAGVKLGRPAGTIAETHKLDDVKDNLIKDLQKGIPKLRLAKIYGVNVSTIYSFMERYDIRL